MTHCAIATLRVSVALILAGLVPAADAAGEECACSADAEYAVRWKPKNGGPKSAEDTLAKLQLDHPEVDRYEVQYFDVASPVDAPPGFTPIARKRSKADKTEFTYKVRGPAPLPSSPSLAEWQCPLPSATERKQETDIAFVSRQQSKTAYSRSCSAKVTSDAIAFPVSLNARPKGCTSAMTRLKAKGVKIEEWRLSNGTKLIEVSQSGKDARADWEAFRDQVVVPLLAKGIKPLDRSKSEMGSTCD